MKRILELGFGIHTQAGWDKYDLLILTGERRTWRGNEKVVLFYLLSESPRDGSQNESPFAKKRALAAPSWVHHKPLLSGWMCSALFQGWAGQGRRRVRTVGLPFPPNPPGQLCLGRNKGADLLGWIGVTLSGTGEIFITPPIRPTNFAPCFTTAQKPGVVTLPATSVDCGHDVSNPCPEPPQGC